MFSCKQHEGECLVCRQGQDSGTPSERQKILQIFTNRLFQLCLSESKGLSQGTIPNWDVCGFFALCQPCSTGTKHRQSQPWSAWGWWGSGAHVHPFRSVSMSPQPSPAAPGHWSTASDWLAEDHASVMPLCLGQRRDAPFIYASLSRDETGEWASDLNIYICCFPPVHSPHF